MRAKGSFITRDGKLFIDCAECKKGGNGLTPDKCKTGANRKKVNIGGCYSGELMDYLQVANG